jgi:sigma-E factor negative regulatory protein RseA
MQEIEMRREQLSALVDGQLLGDEFADVADWLGQAEDAQLTWSSYHVVGEVLRTGHPVDSARDAAFLSRFKATLKQEKPLAPAFKASEDTTVQGMPIFASDRFDDERVSANDSHFSWRLLAGFASLAAVSVIGWQLASGWGNENGASQLAQVLVQPSQSDKAHVQGMGEVQIMIRDPQLDALLAAHRQFGGTSALQMPAGFLRNATFEGAAR